MSLLISKTHSQTENKLLEKKSEQGTKPTRHYSKKQEDHVAKAIGGDRHLNSGATAFIKGDCSNDTWLIECKTKVKASDSISIKKDWIEKNKQEALFMGKQNSAIAFSFGPDEPNYYIIDEYLFQDLLEYLKTEKERN